MFMTRAEEMAWGAAVRSLVPAGWLTATEAYIADNLFWRTRVKGRDRTQIAVQAIAIRIGVGRDAVIRTVQKLQLAGLTEKIQTTIRRAIGAMVRPCRGVNIYVFKVPEALPTGPYKSAIATTLVKARIKKEDGGYPPDSESVPREGCNERECEDRWECGGIPPLAEVDAAARDQIDAPDGAEPPGAVEDSPGGSSVDGMGGSVSGEPGGEGMAVLGAAEPVGSSGQGAPADRGQGGDPAAAAGGTAGARLGGPLMAEPQAPVRTVAEQLAFLAGVDPTAARGPAVPLAPARSVAEQLAILAPAATAGPDLLAARREAIAASLAGRRPP